MKHLTLNIKRQSQSGQALLILIMVFATIITVVLATTFTARTNVQTSKISEESQNALAAAESGIEYALQQTSVTDGVITGGGLPPALTALGVQKLEVRPSKDQNRFISPLIRKDGQYTYYLAPYDKTNAANPFGPSFSQNITFCFDSGSGINTAVELSIIKSNNSIKRIVLDPDNRFTTTPPPSITVNGAGPECSNSDGVTFGYSANIDAANISTDSRVMIVRMLFAESKFMIDGQSGDLPSQGVRVRSEAKTQIGAYKIIELFQSHPQFPSDFFVTQF